MCEACDSAAIMNPLDPFEVDHKLSVEEMPLFLGRDVYDFCEKVKKVYYDKEVFIDYSTNGLLHVQKWFGREFATHQLDDCLKLLEY